MNDRKPSYWRYLYLFGMLVSLLGSAKTFALENGTSITNLASSNDPLRFTLEVPDGATELNFNMSGGSGDADLYVRFGSAPTTSNYDCRPYLNGNNESCSISNIQAGTYHVMLNPYSAFSGVSLVANYQEANNGGGSDPGNETLNETNLSGASNSTQSFSLDVPNNASNLVFAMSGGTGDADLYVRFGAPPTTSSYDCRPYLNGNNETCNISNIQTGTYFVLIRGYSAYSGVALSGTYDSNGGTNQSPNAVIANGPYSGIEGNSINMTSTGSADPDGTISTYFWEFGDGSTSNQSNPSHTYNNAGTYNVALTVTDNDGATGTATTTATITSPANQLPNAVIANGPFTSTAGTSVSMSSSGSNDPDGNLSTYSWDFGDGATSALANPSHTYASSGNFTVTLTVTDNEGATDTASTTAFIAATPNNVPTANISNGPFTSEVGQSISFSSNGSNDSDGSIVTYNWDFGDGNGSTSSTPSHTYLSEGSFTVTLTVTDDDGASASTTSTANITNSSNPGGGELNEGNLSGSTNSTQNFSLDVPSGASNLVFAISGGSGDADLYVRFGSAPTTSSYDCRPYLNGNNENCSFDSPQAGTYFVMVRAYSAYSGLNLTGSYDGGNGDQNQSPIAVIANGPFDGTAGAVFSMSSEGSEDPDGTIASYLWSFGDGSSSSSANPNKSYTEAGTYNILLTVTDNEGATSSVASSATITPAGSGFTVSSHYYDKGSFDFNYTDYETAFSDNFTDNDVEIHSYIVINFSENVRSSTINENNIQVKRLNMPDDSQNNQNLISGSFELLDSNTAIFKPDVKYYVNSGGTFDWNNPNWNGLKPNYQYSVTLSSNIQNTAGESLDLNEQSDWTFETIDNDYGLYWFKDGYTAMKYIPGRDIPLDFYDPSKSSHIYGHGWAKTSVHRQDGQLRDYRREPMTTLPGSMYPSQEAVDIVSIWKDPSQNYEGKAWNFGIVYWNQFADDDYANLSKPQMAEAKIWSTDGRNDMSYAIRNWNGSSWVQDHVETNSPLKPVTVILTDALISSIKDTTAGDLRLSGNSLGNQVITAMSYILKKEYAEGRVNANLFPSRIALLDPYWRGGTLQDNWTDNHPAHVDLGSSNDSSGDLTLKIVTDLIEFADNDPSVSFVAEYYDTSRTTDGSFFGQQFGDRNIEQRDVMAIAYQQASWINGSESDRNYYAHRHVFGRYWYPWQYAFAPPETGFSASSPDSVIRDNMNYYKSTKIRYSISAGGNTPSPEDDNYTLISGSSWQQ